MRSPRWWLGIGGTVVVAVLAGWAADTPTKPPAGPKSPSAPQRESSKSSGGGLGALKLPDGAIIVLTTDAADIQQIPNAVVLKPEEFKKLREQIEQLQRQANPDKPVPANMCRLRGTLDGDVVRIQAEFEFETEKPKARVALGCQKGWPTGAKLDDGSRLPLLSTTANEGYVIQVETPGKHKLTLDLDVPAIAKEQGASERSFVLGLPRAPLTLLKQFDVPAAVHELRIPGRPTILVKQLNSKQSKGEPLGPLDELKVSWKDPAPQPQAAAPLTALGQIKVDIDDAQVTTDAELLLQSTGPVDQWHVYLPPQTRLQDISVEAATIVPPADPVKLPVWTIQLTEPSAKPLRVNVRVQRSRPKPAGNGAAPAVAIGPFTVVNAFRQRGTISITAPTDVRLQFRTHGDVTQSDLLDDARLESGGKLVAVFTYWNLVAPAKPDQLAPALLDMTIEPAKGAVESRLEHTFTLRPDRTWQISTKIEIKPIRTAVDSFVVRLPPGYHYDREVGPSPAELVEDVVIPDTPEDQARDATVRLAQPRRSQPFSVTLVGSYSGPTQENQHVALPLPQVRGTLDRGGPVRASVPAGMEVKLQSADFKAQQAEPWQTDRTPERADLAWRRYRPELVADIEVDVTLTERQARVSERIRFQFASGPMKQVSLRLADFPPGAIPKIEEGGTPAALAVETWPVVLKAPVGKEHTLAFSLSVALPPAQPEEGRVLVMPLAWPEEATRCTTKVRVFGDPSVQPLLIGEGAWSEEPKEVVPDKTILPSLVVLGHGVEIPLKLRLSSSAMPLLPAVVVDRLLMQVAIAEGGYQTYRARFHISKLTHRELELELPSSPASLNLSTLLNGVNLPNWNVVDENGNLTETGRIIRFLDVGPALYEKGSILDVSYRIAPGRQEGNGRWHSTLYPPRLHGNASLGWVRWQIAVPAGWLPLSLEESFSTEEHWGWRGWLPGPSPAATTADLERWIGSGPNSSQAANADSKTSPAPDLNPGSADALVGWETSANALRVYHVPQRAWLLACSLTLLLFGLGLYFARLPRPFYWLVVLGLSLAAVLAGIWWPSVLPAAIYGCVPGALVLAAVVAVQWMFQREYRRRVVFMPGFTRLKPGSSLVRPGSSNRPRGEPSTVDQLPGSGSRALVPGQKAENNAP